MVRRVIQKRQRIPYIIIGCEGKNKTEKSYLTSLYRYLCGRNKYTIKFAPGKHTDPEGIVNDVIRYIKYELDNLQEDDRCYVIFDADASMNKKAQIEVAKKIAREANIELIISNPTVEL